MNTQPFKIVMVTLYPVPFYTVYILHLQTLHAYHPNFCSNKVIILTYLHIWSKCDNIMPKFSKFFFNDETSKACNTSTFWGAHNIFKLFQRRLKIFDFITKNPQILKNRKERKILRNLSRPLTLFLILFFDENSDKGSEFNFARASRASPYSSNKKYLDGEGQD